MLRELFGTLAAGADDEDRRPDSFRNPEEQVESRWRRGETGLQEEPKAGDRQNSRGPAAEEVDALVQAHAGQNQAQDRQHRKIRIPDSRSATPHFQGSPAVRD